MFVLHENLQLTSNFINFFTSVIFVECLNNEKTTYTTLQPYQCPIEGKNAGCTSCAISRVKVSSTFDQKKFVVKV